jgi:hypothetical protein
MSEGELELPYSPLSSSEGELPLPYSTRKCSNGKILTLGIEENCTYLPGGVWNPFHSKSEIISMFKSMFDSAKATGIKCDYRSLGKDSCGNDIWLFTIGTDRVGNRILWDGALHGNEDYGTEVIYMLAQWLLQGGSHENYRDRILRRNYVMFIPSVLSKFYRCNGNISTCEHGVNLNRNFVTGWSASDCTDNYSGTSPASEVETQILRNVFNDYKPAFYVNLHQGGGPYMSYTPNMKSAVDLKNTLVSELGTDRFDSEYEVSSPSNGMAYADAYRVYGIPSCLIELYPSWRHESEQWNYLVNTAYPRCKALLIAQAELCGIEPPPTPSPPEVIATSFTSLFSATVTLYILVSTAKEIRKTLGR